MADDVEFTSVSPVIPIRDLDAAMDCYRRLGFDTHAYPGPEPYGYADRGFGSLHFSEWAGHDPDRAAASVYIYVSDADALHAAWRAAGVDGRFVKPHNTPTGSESLPTSISTALLSAWDRRCPLSHSRIASGTARLRSGLRQGARRGVGGGGRGRGRRGRWEPAWRGAGGGARRRGGG